MNVNRIGLVLCSSTAQPIPSTRVAVINMLPFLRSAGLQTCLLFESAQPSETPDLTGVALRALEAGCQVVILQKVRGASAVALARELSTAGVRTIYAVCDQVDLSMVEATTGTVIVTEYLKSLCPAALHKRIHVVHDGIERPEACKSAWGSEAGSNRRPLRAVLVTSTGLDRLPVLGQPPDWLKVRIVGRYSHGFNRMREIRWTMAALRSDERIDYLRFLVNRHIECVPWHPEGVYKEMVQADIAVIPIETPTEKSSASIPPAWMLKSENRLTLKMSMGLPVIATPIPSYEPLIEHGINGFFARTRHDWEVCLTALRDPDRRREMGLAARASVTQRYSMQEQAGKLLRAIQIEAT